MEKQEMTQMLEQMLARIDANRKIDKEELKEKMNANNKTMLAEILEKTDANRKADQENLKEMIEKMNASHMEVLVKMEGVTSANQAKTDAKLTETIEKTQMELLTTEVSFDARTRKLQEDLTETKNKLQARLEAVETRTERVAGTSIIQPPTFNGNTTWSVFRRQFEIVAGHNRWSDREKSTYLITALKGRALDVLYGIPTSTTYEETLQALEDRFGDQHFSAAYRCQLTTGTQKAGASLQDFATAIEQLAHRAYPTLPEDHIRRETGRAFAYGVKDSDIKIQLLLGGEKAVNEALGQALELQAVLVAPRPHQNNTNTYRGNRSPPTRRKDAQQSGCWSCGEAGHFQSNCPMRKKSREQPATESRS
jgi:hypothetical protein